MATTYIKPYKTSKGFTAVQTMYKSFDYGAPTTTKAICTTIFTIILPPWTAPGNSIILSARLLPCGDYLTVYA